MYWKYLLVLVLLGVLNPAFGQHEDPTRMQRKVDSTPQPKVSPKKIAFLVRQLGADGPESYLVREKARFELAQMGKNILPLVRRELKQSKDAEVRRSLERLISDLDPIPIVSAKKFVAILNKAFVKEARSKLDYLQEIQKLIHKKLTKDDKKTFASLTKGVAERVKNLPPERVLAVYQEVAKQVSLFWRQILDRSKEIKTQPGKLSDMIWIRYKGKEFLFKPVGEKLGDYAISTKPTPVPVQKTLRKVMGKNFHVPGMGDFKGPEYLPSFDFRLEGSVNDVQFNREMAFSVDGLNVSTKTFTGVPEGETAKLNLNETFEQYHNEVVAGNYIPTDGNNGGGPVPKQNPAPQPKPN